MDCYKASNKQKALLSLEDTQLIKQGWRLKKQIKQKEKALSLIQQKLAERHGLNCSLVVEGLCRTHLKSVKRYQITKAQNCKSILKERFNDLVEEHISYKLHENFKQILDDKSNPLGWRLAPLLKCTVIKVLAGPRCKRLLYYRCVLWVRR